MTPFFLNLILLHSLSTRSDKVPVKSQGTWELYAPMEVCLLFLVFGSQRLSTSQSIPNLRYPHSTYIRQYARSTK
ncbi:hypothetical protein BDP27DRAFT_595675 [Rhodocollybia butyracea]|uniref:Secreted protein n=1 Tax=Rhodocollybia butyracea TaxID=206335 RepID=A0A9P5TXK0_9AGAR|nr:hypothetical protein BDP27DRAFT_595675 [Rhodocollybia butyracea]